jgi:5-methylcytosine-specific restriction endonuclease McrA
MSREPLPKRKGPSKAQLLAEKWAKEKAMRDQVWERDKGRCRACGAVLSRDIDAPAARRGEVAHLRPRNVMPEWKLDELRAILMSASHHALSDARGGYRLKLTDPETGEPATDASKPIRFVCSDLKGNIQWTRVG